MLNIFAKSIMTAARNPAPQPKASRAHRAEATARETSKPNAEKTAQRRA
ncbi:hypothetical protein [Roseovarius dicentrarchi]|nr:hypothetical protein [Roseovarius dicentrarchi]